MLCPGVVPTWAWDAGDVRVSEMVNGSLGDSLCCVHLGVLVPSKCIPGSMCVCMSQGRWTDCVCCYHNPKLHLYVSACLSVYGCERKREILEDVGTCLYGGTFVCVRHVDMVAEYVCNMYWYVDRDSASGCV